LKVNRPSHFPLPQGQRQIGRLTPFPQVPTALLDNVPNLTQVEAEAARTGHIHRSIKQRLADRDHLVELLTDAGKLVEARKLKVCGNRLLFRQRADCGRIETWRSLNGCNLRFCPFCSRSKANNQVKDHWPAIWAYARRNPALRPCGVTLTYRDNDPNWRNLPLKVKFKRTQRYLRKLIRHPAFKDHVPAGIWRIEHTKDSPESYGHVHVHLLVFRKAFWEQPEITALWADVTDGLGGHTWINSKAGDGSMADLKATLVETLKYAMKPASIKNWTAIDAGEWVECKGLKLTSRFGSELYGLKLTEHEQFVFETMTAGTNQGSGL